MRFFRYNSIRNLQDGMRHPGLKTLLMILAVLAAIALGSILSSASIAWSNAFHFRWADALIDWISSDAAPVQKNIAPSVYQVEGENVLREDFSVETTVAGSMRASQSVVIRPSMDGKITSLSFKEGELVQPNAVLITLDNVALKARLKEQEATLALSKANYDRASKLFNKKIYTQKDYDKALAELKVSEAQVEQAKDALEKTILRAPFDGLVGLVDVSVGAYVRAGDELVTLHDIDPIQVEFRLSENMIQDIHTGQKVRVAVEGFEESLFEGEVTGIDTKVDPLTHSILVRASIPNGDAALRPGLFARVTFATAVHENAIMVPESAIQVEGQKEFVMVGWEGSIARAPIETGGRRAGLVEVRSGLRGDEQIVTSGWELVPPGAPVEFIPSRRKGDLA